jgi:hypothetical protein
MCRFWVDFVLIWVGRIPVRPALTHFPWTGVIKIPSREARLLSRGVQLLSAEEMVSPPLSLYGNQRLTLNVAIGGERPCL